MNIVGYLQNLKQKETNLRHLLPTQVHSYHQLPFLCKQNPKNLTQDFQPAFVVPFSCPRPFPRTIVCTHNIDRVWKTKNKTKKQASLVNEESPPSVPSPAPGLIKTKASLVHQEALLSVLSPALKKKNLHCHSIFTTDYTPFGVCLNSNHQKRKQIPQSSPDIRHPLYPRQRLLEKQNNKKTKPRTSPDICHPLYPRQCLLEKKKTSIVTQYLPPIVPSPVSA